MPARINHQQEHHAPSWPMATKVAVKAGSSRSASKIDETDSTYGQREAQETPAKLSGGCGV